MLRQHGFDASVLRHGVADWRAEGRPVAVGSGE
jgi:rhodanese-related sulfurtransferase